MADITMCMNGDKCIRRKTCYRYTAKAHPLRQSVAPFFNEGKMCSHYWRIGTEEKKQIKNVR